MFAVSSKTPALPAQQARAKEPPASKIMLISVGLAIKNVSKCKVQCRFRFRKPFS